MIDGVWLRSAMTGGVALESGLARDLIFDLIARSVGPVAPALSQVGSFSTINPATGDVLATIRIDGAAEVDKAVARAAAAQKLWAKMPVLTARPMQPWPWVNTLVRAAKAEQPSQLV